MEEDFVIESKNEHKDKVHGILAHSYSVYFAFFLMGILFDFWFEVKITDINSIKNIGIFFVIFASLLILWAQKTSRNLKKESLSKDSFSKGPYAYTRSPTHWGLFFLMLGFGIMTEAIFVILFALISLLVSRIVYLKKQEEILEKKYGFPYIEYKKNVKL